MGEPGQQAADVGSEFARLMSGAAQAAAGPDPAAPYGYTTDRQTGERRPKRAPGRPRNPPPPLDELKAEAAAAAATGDGTPPAPDQPPDEDRRGRGRHGAPTDSGDDHEAPYTPGVISRGMNRLYRRAGRIVRTFDYPVGAALIEATRRDPDDDEDDRLTVGDAWEELARTNVRIRRALLRLIRGGAWGQLAAAHAPILLALLMKPGIIERIPFGNLIAALAGDELAELDDDDDQDDDDRGNDDRGAGGPLGGLTEQDVAAMAAMAQRIGWGASPPAAARMAGRAA